MRKLHQFILLRVHLQERDTHQHNLVSHPDSLRFACGAPKTKPMHSEKISCPFGCKMVKAYMGRIDMTGHMNGSKTIDEFTKTNLTDIKV